MARKQFEISSGCLLKLGKNYAQKERNRIFTLKDLEHDGDKE